MGRARGPSTGGPRHALLGHGPRPLLGRPVGPRPLMRPAGTVDHVHFVKTSAYSFYYIILIPRAVIKRWGPGISPSYYKCDPTATFIGKWKKNRTKSNP